MLQIVGWLGCVYLLVKSIEIFASSSFRTEAGKLKESAMIGALIAFWGAVGFAIWLSAQGSAGGFGSELSLGSGYEETDPSSASAGSDPIPVNDCTRSAKTDAEMRACK